MAGIPRYTLKIGTNPNYKFKGEVEGSNKAFALVLDIILN